MKVRVHFQPDDVLWGFEELQPMPFWRYDRKVDLVLHIGPWHIVATINVEPSAYDKRSVKSIENALVRAGVAPDLAPGMAETWDTATLIGIAVGVATRPAPSELGTSRLAAE